MRSDALQRAIDAAGGQNPLAKAIGVRQSTLWYWLRAKRGVPAEWCIAIQNQTGVLAVELRPDVFGVHGGIPKEGGSSDHDQSVGSGGKRHVKARRRSLPAGGSI